MGTLPNVAGLVPVVFGLCVSGHEAVAHTGDFILPVYELPTRDLPDLHDGTLDDWDAVVPGTSGDHSLAWTGQTTTPDDLAWRLYLAWHHGTQRLLVGLEMVDDIHDPVGITTGDQPSVAVDADHGGGPFSSAAGGVANSLAQEYKILSAEHSRSGVTQLYSSGLRSWFYQAPWAEYGYEQHGEAPSLSVWELSVAVWDSIGNNPDESIRSALEPNAIIGLRVQITDEDDGRDGASLYLPRPVCDSCSIGPALWADSFGDAQLIPCRILDCSGVSHEPITAVLQDSWGRIKASL